MDNQQLLRYSRHILLDDISIEGQEKLLNAKVFVIGCGGLGCAVLPYLVASGIGKLIIADHDHIDESNLQRQICYTEQDIGKPKVEVMRQFLHKLNQHCQIQSIQKKLSLQEIQALIADCDVIIDCSDNFQTRQAINIASVKSKTPLISGAAVRFTGQIAIYRPDLDEQACYRCLFDSDTANDGTCIDTGVFSPLVAIIGASQAIETLKVLLALPTQSNILRCYNALTSEWTTFPFEKNPECSVCAV